MKYRKKPVVIEAIQLLPNHQSIIECIEFVFSIGMETSIIGMAATINQTIENEGFLIDTLEGQMKASFGDYIIKGIKGEFYPCKSEVFNLTYEEVNND